MTFDQIIPVTIPKNCTHNVFLQAIAETGAIDAEQRHLNFNLARDCFVSSSALAFFCSWGMRQLARGCKFSFGGDYNALKYLSRMNLFDCLDYEFIEHFERHTDTGRFLPVLAVDSSQSAHDAVNQLCDLILYQFDNAREFLPAVEWAFNEIVDNIFIHSETPVPGVACAQYYPQKHRLDMGICDMGRGIYASLSESQELISHGDAITKALLRGVTRNKDIGQGNGLAGSLAIAEANQGSFQIWTGNICFELGSNGKPRFLPIPDTLGTGISISLDTQRPVNLSDTFIGDSESTFIFSESERGSEREGLKILEECLHTGGRAGQSPPAKNFSVIARPRRSPHFKLRRGAQRK